MADQTYDDILEEVFREKPTTDEERAWAEHIILVRFRPKVQSAETR